MNSSLGEIAGVVRSPQPNSRPTVRRTMVLAHRYAGLLLAVFLIVAAVTGTAIAFYKELDHALNPDLYQIIERSQPPLSNDILVEKIRQAHPQAFINVMMLDRRPGESVRVRLSPLKDSATGEPYTIAVNEIFVDPFDGRILGGRDHGAFRADRAHLMPFIYLVHYTLYLPGSWGVWLMGIVALVWMFDCFVGFYVTLPPSRGPSRAHVRKSWWQRWRPAWQIKRGASATRMNFDLHRAGGLWFWLVLFMLGLTGVYFNLKTEVFRPVLGAIASLSEETTPVLQKLPQAFAPVKLSFDDAIAAAQRQRTDSTEDMVLAYVGLVPDAPGIYRVRFADAERGDRNWHFHYENMFIDGVTGALVRRVSYFEGTAGDKFILWQYPLHSGQVFGFWGRVFIGLTGIFVVMLSITGIVIWLKKRRLPHRGRMP